MKIGIIYREYVEGGLAKDFLNIFNNLNISFEIIKEDSDIEKISKKCSALIVPGDDNDIPPKYYNEVPKDNGKYKIDDYALDSKAISYFCKYNKPILGICGGIQSINVFFGGSLYEDIDNHSLNGNLHEIAIEEDSFIYDVYNNKRIMVNSYHHQAIKDLANNFKITARANDGIIEAIEHDNIIGVQWHPEKSNDLNFFKKWINKYLKK